MTPIAPLITAFLREHMPMERGYSPNTCETYAHAFRLLFEFAGGRLRKRPSQLYIEHITAALVLDFLRHIEKTRSNSAVTRNSRLAAVKALCDTSNYACLLHLNKHARFELFQRNAMIKPWSNTSR